MSEKDKGNLGEAIEEVVEIAEETVRNPFVVKLARLGFYTKGSLFIVIGTLAFLVTIGAKNGELAAPTGALAAIAQISFGRVILIIFVIGAFGHGLWNILRGAADVDNAGNGVQGIAKRIISAGIGIFYMVLAWTAWDLIIKAQVTSSDDQAIQKTLTTMLLALPFGAILVGLIGLGTIGAGVHECYSGLSGKFQESFRLREIKDSYRRIITVLGALSFTARALIFALIGYFFIWAAIDFNPNEAVGMDGALLTLAQSKFGKILLFVTAAGLIAHGVLALFEAKYRRIC